MRRSQLIIMANSTRLWKMNVCGSQHLPAEKSTDGGRCIGSKVISKDGQQLRTGHCREFKQMSVLVQQKYNKLHLKLLLYQPRGTDKLFSLYGCRMPATTTPELTPVTALMIAKQQSQQEKNAMGTKANVATQAVILTFLPPPINHNCVHYQQPHNTDRCTKRANQHDAMTRKL